MKREALNFMVCKMPLHLRAVYFRGRSPVDRAVHARRTQMPGLVSAGAESQECCRFENRGSAAFLCGFSSCVGWSSTASMGLRIRQVPLGQRSIKGDRRGVEVLETAIFKRVGFVSLHAGAYTAFEI